MLISTVILIIVSTVLMFNSKDISPKDNYYFKLKIGTHNTQLF